MESHDSYPVFHTRLARTLRRRFTKPDGTHAGWLILNTDQLTEVTADPAVHGDITVEDNRLDTTGGDDPPRLSIPHPR